MDKNPAVVTSFDNSRGFGFAKKGEETFFMHVSDIAGKVPTVGDIVFGQVYPAMQGKKYRRLVIPNPVLPSDVPLQPGIGELIQSRFGGIFGLQMCFMSMLSKYDSALSLVKFLILTELSGEDLWIDFTDHRDNPDIPVEGFPSYVEYKLKEILG